MATETMKLVPHPSPNTTAHSPNRKPRTRMQRYQAHRYLEREGLKRLWLRLYQATGSEGTATDRIGRFPSTVARWLVDDKEFHAARIAIRDTWDGILHTRFDAMGDKALDKLENILDNDLTEDKDLIRIIQWILKSRGVGRENGEVRRVEHRISGPGGGAIPIMVAPAQRVPELVAASVIEDVPYTVTADDEEAELEEGEE